jgi:putative transposase
MREAIRVMSELLMELEARGQIGAERYERSDKRITQRNGYRERTWETRVGEIDLHIPKLRQGSYYPSLLEPRRRAEQALLAVIQQAYIEGVSVRRVDDLLKALGLTGIDKSAVSRICHQLDGVVEQFRQRPLQGGYPYLWLDALYVKVRQNRPIVNQAVIIGIGVHETGEREVVGFAVASAASVGWIHLLLSLLSVGGGAARPADQSRGKGPSRTPLPSPARSS